MIKFIKRNWDYLILSFFAVSIICWFLEMGYSLIFRSKLVLPGAWLGPYCPIYGIAYVIIVLLIQKKDNIVFNAVKIFITVSIIEYIISYISGDIFNNVIWDYSNRFLNINGRICLEMSLLFMVMGLTIIYIIDPLFRRIS